MNWIFEELTKNNSNPFEQKIIDVESSPQRGDLYSPYNLIYWNDTLFYTIPVRNANFTFEFRKNLYIIHKYRMRSIENACHPKGWVVEGSIDNIKYEVIHLHKKNLCDVEGTGTPVCSETFSVDNLIPVRFIRVVQVDGECTGGLNFGLSAIDFYGLISPLIKPSCAIISFNSKWTYLFILLITY